MQALKDDVILPHLSGPRPIPRLVAPPPDPWSETQNDQDGGAAMSRRDQRTVRMQVTKSEQSGKFRYPIIRLTSAEKRLVEERLRQSGKSAQAFGKDCLLGHPIVVLDGFLQLTEQIRRIGVNVNQVAKVANYDEHISPEQLSNLQKDLKQIWQLLNNFLLAVHQKSETR